jgi:hypothetical protein
VTAYPQDLRPPRFELLDAHPAVNLPEAEYRRLLGYPRHHVPGERADELAAAARQYYATHGRPWVYLREVELLVTDRTLRLDGVEFHSPHLQEHLRETGAVRVALVAVSAGPECEEEARRRWEDAKPDEYFFLEVFGSAVVEHLVASLNGRLCDLAERDGLMAVPHYSPGYTGWDIADQNKLFALIAGGRTAPFPAPLAVLPSGMLKPKKSLLAVVGLTARTREALASPRLAPCENCAFAPCQYRRAPYRHAPALTAPAAPPARAAAPPAPAPQYTVNARALAKWARERVRLELREGGVEANFRFDGTTCSNQGRPLAFDYRVMLRASDEGYAIVGADCRPAPGDEGHKFMCAHLSDEVGLMDAIRAEQPLLGRPLHEVLAWDRPAAPSGCYCTPESRTHKWGLALEVIHFALAQSPALAPSTPGPESP